MSSRIVTTNMCRDLFWGSGEHHRQLRYTLFFLPSFQWAVISAEEKCYINAENWDSMLNFAEHSRKSCEQSHGPGTENTKLEHVWMALTKFQPATSYCCCSLENYANAMLLREGGKTHRVQTTGAPISILSQWNKPNCSDRIGTSEGLTGNTAGWIGMAQISQQYYKSPLRKRILEHFRFLTVIWFPWNSTMPQATPITFLACPAITIR